MTEYVIVPGSPLDVALDAAVGMLDGAGPTPEQTALIKTGDGMQRTAQRIALGARVAARMAGIAVAPDDPQARETWYGGIVGKPAPHTAVGDFLALVMRGNLR